MSLLNLDLYQIRHIQALYLLLIYKTSKISDNLTQDLIPQIYDFDKLKEVLAVGFEDENVYEIPYLDFQSISMVIDKNYI